MTITRIQAAIAFVLMACAMAAAHLWRPTAHLADSRAKIELEQMFPAAFGDWKVDTSLPVQLVAPDMQQFLAKIYSQTLSRTYINGQGQRIMLSVAYGGDQSDATRAHRPEVCYPAQGFQIVANQTGVVDTVSHALRVRQLVARAGSRTEPISYWVTVGDRTALSGTEQKLAQLSYSARGIIPDGMLVRVSNIDSNAPASYALHAGFINQMTRAMPQQVRDRIVGATGA
jgi:EpsI family protein